MDKKVPINLPSAPTRKQEKQHGLPATHAVRHGCVVFVLLLLGTYLACGRHIGYPEIRPVTNAEPTDVRCQKNPDAIWGKINESTDLIWTRCYEDKQCAKLSVPLDYTEDCGRQAIIALLKVPSTIPAGQDGYLGPVLINPGGPGASGVRFVQTRGERLQTVLGDGYDIIGFDPRGVGFTEPSLNLFPDASERASWELRHAADPSLNATPDALARDNARWQVFGDLAKERLADAGQYVSTALVARDMLRITEAHGYEKLKYWGFSYGSVLGITFASMFPDKVGRLVVDGVCDTYDYYKGQWSSGLRDTDIGLHMIYKSCVEAGPKACALFAPDAEGVKARTNTIFAKLKTHPLPVLAPMSDSSNSDTADYGLVDYTMARDLVFQFLYSPYYKEGMNAALVADALAAIEHGDGRPLWDLALTSRTKDFKCDCDQDKDSKLLPRLTQESKLAILCSDTDVVEDNTAELQADYENMAKMSSFAEFMDVRVNCAGWKIRPKERFRGSFMGNTSHPMLLIGNTADPVTPLWNARKMALGFKDAAVLHQKSAGHCSPSAVSLCTAKVVRDYFRHGMLPPAGKECEVESRFFGGPTKVLDQVLSSEDAKLLQAVRELSSDFELAMLHM